MPATKALMGRAFHWVLGMVMLFGAAFAHADLVELKLKRFSTLQSSLLRQRQQDYKKDAAPLSFAEQRQLEQRLRQQRQQQGLLQYRQRQKQIATGTRLNSSADTQQAGNQAHQFQRFKAQQRFQQLHLRMQRATWPYPYRRRPTSDHRSASSFGRQ